MKYYLQIILMFTLVYNQVVFAKPDFHKPIKLSEIVSKYNEMRKSPLRVGKYLSKTNWDKLSSMFKAMKLEKLPVFKKIKNKYVLKAGKHTIILDNKNWKSKKIRINNYLLDISKVKNIPELKKAIARIISKSSKSSKKTSFMSEIWNILFPSARAFTFNKNMFLIFAAVATVVDIGTYALSGDNDNSSSSNNSPDQGNQQPDPEEHTPIGGPNPEYNEKCASTTPTIGEIIFDHCEIKVAKWPVTSPLEISLNHKFINLNYNKKSVWPVVGGAVGNAFIIYNRNCKWYGSSWEWLRPNQTRKFTENFIVGQKVGVGERIGFMVTGKVRRCVATNAKERTGIAWTRFPSKGKTSSGSSSTNSLMSDNGVYTEECAKKTPKLEEITFDHCEKKLVGWKETAKLTAKFASAKFIDLNYDKKSVWPVDGGAVGNAFIIYNRNCKWHGASFEWMRPNQVRKFTENFVKGHNIKSGERIGFMMTGKVRRCVKNNVKERSNISWTRFP